MASTKAGFDTLKEKTTLIITLQLNHNTAEKKTWQPQNKPQTQVQTLLLTYKKNLKELTVLENEDFLENLRVLSCFVQLKSVLFNVLCVLDLAVYSFRRPTFDAELCCFAAGHVCQKGNYSCCLSLCD